MSTLPQRLARFRPWPAGLRGQLIVLLLVGLAVSQIAAFILLTDERQSAIRSALAADLAARTARVVSLIDQVPPELRRTVLEAASTRRTTFRLSQSEGVAATSSEEAATILRDYLLVALDGEQRFDSRDRVKVEIDRHRGPDDNPPGQRPHLRTDVRVSVQLAEGGWLLVTASFRRPPFQWAWPIVLSAGLAALAVVMVVTLTIGRTTRSLRALAGAADRFGRGARDETVPPTGPREARQLISAFNEMQERLSRFVSERTQLLAAISHDLRTPITGMRLRAELVEDLDTRARLIDGLDEMQRLAEATLTFAREEAMQEPIRSVDLTALVESLVDDFAEMGTDVSMADAPTNDALPQIVQCRTTAIKRALRNLIENAVRYGGVARLSIEGRAGAILVHVDDDGPGLATDRIEEMFQPFTRLEASRSRETGGVGLGLPICRSILQAHGGDVLLRNRAEGGLRATLSLPSATI